MRISRQSNFASLEQQSDEQSKQLMEIRLIHSSKELLEVVAVEQAAWGFNDLLESTPPHVMQASNEVGGMVLGAFEHEELLGFCYTIPAFDKTLKAYHHLHSLGIMPHVRDQQIGFKLLRAHQNISLEMGIAKITWTFDPLESRNANLYMKKIGAIIETPYIANMYGSNVLGGINAGIPADRLIATWHLDAPEIKEHVKTASSLEALTSAYPVLKPEATVFPESPFLIEIPGDFQKIKSINLDEALLIRLEIREALTKVLSSHRKLIHFYSIGDENRRNFYLVE